MHDCQGVMPDRFWESVFGLLLLCFFGLACFASGGQPGGGAGLPVPVPDKLGGKDRMRTFVSTDKPIYKPGETMYARVVVLRADTFFPVPYAGLPVKLVVVGPKGEELAILNSQLSDSTAGFSWEIPENQAGGRFRVTAKLFGGESVSRPIEIRAYAPPRLRSQIEFIREGYGPGQKVEAVASIKRAEGGVPEGARVTAVARIDGEEAARLENLTVDGQGNCRAEFRLPEKMERGEGTLAFLIEDGGVVETASKTIPILLQTLDIAFYPEGGELVAGLPGRVYVQARRPDGKPADVEGMIVEVENADARPGVVSVATLHEGRGVFSFTPEASKSYALRLDNPAGIDRLFPLPPVRSSGVALRSEQDVYSFDEPIVLTVCATPDADANRVTLFQREKLLASAAWEGDGRVELDAGDAEGVFMATIWDAAGRPLAERLIFRRPKFAVKVAVKAETEPAGQSPIPGGKIKLTVTTTDETGRPVEAVVGLEVTDDSLLEMVEKRDQSPSLPVMVYLENEVEDLADAHVYFDSNNPDVGRDIDLLLGVQGWRRFVLARFDELLKERPDAVRRILAIQEKLPPPSYALDNGLPRPVIAMARGDFAEMKMEEMMVVEDAVEAPMAVPPEPVQELEGADLEKRMEELNVDLRVAEAVDVEPRAMMAKRQAIAMRKPMPRQYILVREYAHQARPNRRPNDRTDFTETLYWNAGVRTHPRNGTAEVSFSLSDSVTTFRVRADAFAGNGALGCGEAEIESKEPFYISPKLPVSVVSGDRVLMPVALVNSTDQVFDNVGVIFRSEELTPDSRVQSNPLAPGERGRTVVGFVADKPGRAKLTVNAAAGGYADSVTRELTILPRGFPVHLTASGLVGPEKGYGGTFVVAPDILPGSLAAAVKVYPSPLANMEEALNALLRQPHGCFEQTSSTNYPLVMAQLYFTSHTGIPADKVGEATRLLEQGYKKLVGFECPEEGYEWFGGDPGHEALTAYGLMQFSEMAKVMPVDSDMLTRTRNWLLSRRDGAGGFMRNEKALDSFGRAPAPLTNLYILWSLLESGEKPETLTKEIEAARAQLAETKDPYILALGMNVMYLAADLAAARRAADSLAKMQDGSGALGGAETSITRSGGESLTLETTALAVIGWLRAGNEYAGAVEAAMSWLFEQCKSGRFGSTQSTILALKAINAYDAARARPKAPGEVRLLVDGKPFGRPVVFDQDSQGALELPDFAAAMTPGEHRIELDMIGGGDMPFALEITYTTPRPADSVDCPLTLRTSLSTRETDEGEPVDLHVVVAAPDKDVSMPLAVIGLPAGLEPRHERLKELTAEGRISSYEILGRELVLYWRMLAAGEKVELAIPLIADIPGEYTGPASRVYAYYLEEHKNWAAGEKITINPR